MKLKEAEEQQEINNANWHIQNLKMRAHDLQAATADGDIADTLKELKAIINDADAAISALGWGK